MTAAHGRADRKGQRTIAQPSARKQEGADPRSCSMGLPRDIILWTLAVAWASARAASMLSTAVSTQQRSRREGA